MKTNFLWPALLLCATVSFAQKEKIKWGQIDAADLAMTHYPTDSAAGAAVLYEAGNLTFRITTGSPEYSLDYHQRIKIFKRSDFDRADIAIPYYGDDRLANLRAQVILPSGEKVELKKKDFFEEKVSENWTKVSFSFPNIEEGSIVEYQYRLSSKSYVQLKTWVFQRDIPVRWSEYALKIPEWFDYLVIRQGEPLDVEEVTKSAENYYYNGKVSGQSGSIPALANNYHMVLKDAPALKEESYITTMDDYVTKARFQLRSIQYPNSPIEPVLKDWQGLAEQLTEHDHFGGQFLKRGKYKDILKAIDGLTAGATTEKEKAQKLYNFISANLEWNGSYSFMAAEDLNHCFKVKSANSAELNLLLLALLRSEGIKARPLLLSTRNHGRMFDIYPILSQFNHVMILAELDGVQEILDAGSAYRPIGYPRVNALNYQAWIVDKDAPQWIDFNAPESSTVQYLTFDWNDELKLNGKMQSRYIGYDAISLLEDMMKEDDTPDSETTGSDSQAGSGGIRESYPEATIENVKVKDYTLPTNRIESEMVCTLPGAAQANGDFIYMQSILMPPLDEHPFKLERRTYPVEIPHPINYQQIFNVKTPPGYVIEELPEPIRVSIPNGGGSFVFNISENPGGVQVLFKLSLKQLRFQPTEYEAVKNFFDHVIKKQDEVVVFKKA